MDEWRPKFSGGDWDDLYTRLLLYAEGRIRRLYWPRGRPQAHDFVQRAIEKAWSGKRTYDGSKNLFHNLCQIISGDINHQVESFDNRNVSSSDDTVFNIVDCRTPEDIAYDREVERRFLAYVSFHDPLAGSIADLILKSDVKESSELAIELGRPVREIENGKKRLRRFTRKYLDKIKEEFCPITKSLEVVKVLCLLDEN